MDYCHACRRHLNGALACAGCGTPVERLRYDTPHAPPPAAPHEGAEAPEPYPTGPSYATDPYADPYAADPYAPEPYPASYGSGTEQYAPASHGSGAEPYPPASHGPGTEPYPPAAQEPEAGAPEPLAPEHVYELDLVVPPPRPAGRAAGRAAARRRKRGRGGRAGRG
ncbi:SCO2400 family protein, partial [Streptomyces hydrogenans]|uniref:SCO2400 family protein n=1 Tax=Streptomyces hydrogenans TaxID=1873719 RepID=UPI0035E4BCC2